MVDRAKFDQAIAKFDALNKQDPNLEVANGQTYAKEYLYSIRMSEMLQRYMPEASEAVQLAVRCQHIQRWKIARSSYAMTKPAYFQWRNDLKKMHAETAKSVLSEVGYDETLIAQVCTIVKKEGLKTSADTQTLEDVIVLVFLESYLEQFVAEHSDYELDKFVDILNKTLRKTSNNARVAALKIIKLPTALAALVTPLIQGLIE